MSTTMEYSSDSGANWDPLDYQDYTLERGNGKNLFAPKLTVYTHKGAGVSVDDIIKLTIDSTRQFEGYATTSGKIRADGSSKIVVYGYGYDIKDKKVTISESSASPETIISSAISGTSYSLTTPVATGVTIDSYDVENRKIGDIISDMIDRTGYIIKITPDKTIHFQSLEGEGSWQSINVETDKGIISEWDPQNSNTIRNKVTINGTGERNNVATVTQTDYTYTTKEHSAEYNFNYITTTTEATSMATQLLEPEPLASGKITIGESGYTPSIYDNLVNYTIQLTDASKDISSEVVVIEKQSVKDGRIELGVGEGVSFNIHNVNRKSKSDDDKTEPGVIIGGNQVYFTTDHTTITGMSDGDIALEDADSDGEYETIYVYNGDTSSWESGGDITMENMNLVNYIGSSAPSNPNDGWLWVDTSVNPYVLKRYDSSVPEWTSIATLHASWSQIVDDDGKMPQDNATENKTVVASSAPDPASYSQGDVWIDSDSGTPYTHDGTGWKRSAWADISTDPNAPEDDATKNDLVRQSSEPTIGNYSAGDMWVDSDNGNPYIHDGSAWQRTTWDIISGDANAPADNATENKTIVQSTEPTPANYSQGDVWIDDDTGTPYTHNGSGWVMSAWSDISSDPDAPEDNATKSEVIRQSSEPTASNYSSGDVWIDTDTGQPYLHNGNDASPSWERTSWSAISGDIGAPSDNATKNDTTIASTSPSGNKGDIWIDSDTYNPYIHDGTGWRRATWEVIKNDTNAPSDNATKNVDFVQSSKPAGTSGDLWIDTDTNTPYIHDGTDWRRVKWSDLSADTGAPADNATKNIDYVQSAEPTGSSGDIWIDTDSNVPYLHDGTDWRRVDWSIIRTDANAPDDNADVTKQHTDDINYVSSGAPSSPEVGWYWLDTDTDELKRYNGSSWIVQVDLTGSNPQNFSWVVDDGNKPENSADVTKVHASDINHIGGSAPSSPEDGWMWLDTSTDPDTLKKYNGSGWDTVGTVHASWSQVVDDGGKPIDNATKNVDFVQSSEPTGTSGDLWIDTDDNTPFIHDGTDWRRVSWSRISTDSDAPASGATVNESFVQSGKPGDTSDGNLWIDSDTNTPYIADGSDYYRISWSDISSDSHAPVDDADVTGDNNDKAHTSGDHPAGELHDLKNGSLWGSGDRIYWDYDTDGVLIYNHDTTSKLIIFDDDGTVDIPKNIDLGGEGSASNFHDQIIMWDEINANAGSSSRLRIPVGVNMY